jgi:hypothetical protein
LLLVVSRVYCTALHRAITHAVLLFGATYTLQNIFTVEEPSVRITQRHQVVCSLYYLHGSSAAVTLWLFVIRLTVLHCMALSFCQGD